MLAVRKSNIFSDFLDAGFEYVNYLLQSRQSRVCVCEKNICGPELSLANPYLGLSQFDQTYQKSASRDSKN